jgi:hypothetical protein
VSVDLYDGCFICDALRPERATRTDPTDRHRTVEEFVGDWRRATT